MLRSTSSMYFPEKLAMFDGVGETDSHCEILDFGLLCFLLGFTIKNGATLLFSRNQTILLPIFLFSKISICSQSRLFTGFVAIFFVTTLS